MGASWKPRWPQMIKTLRKFRLLKELENFFQDTPELQEAPVGYMEARSRLLAKKKSRAFKSGGKGKGKHREQLLARIARSTCRICGEKWHWKAEPSSQRKSQQ